MIDLNSASAEELTTLPTVGLAAAYDLILFRPYLHWDEVQYAPGFSPDRMAEIREGGATLGPPPGQRPLLEIDRRDVQT